MKMNIKKINKTYLLALIVPLVYFILSLPRFFDLLGSKEAIYEKLVWLPTWHQAQLICRCLGIQMDGIAKSDDAEIFDPCEALLNVYVSIKNALSKK